MSATENEKDLIEATNELRELYREIGYEIMITVLPIEEPERN